MTAKTADRPTRDWLDSALLIPSWVLSCCFHAAMIWMAAQFIDLMPRQPAGFSNEPTREIGIVIKETGAGVDPDPVHPNPTETTSTPNASEIGESSPLTATPATAPAELRTPDTSATPAIGPAVPGTILGSPSVQKADGNVASKSTGERLSGAAGGASFMGIKDQGTRVVFVIDCSGSMVSNNAIRVAKASLVASIQALDSKQQFQVIFYNDFAYPLRLTEVEKPAMIFATDINKTRARQKIAAISPDLGTQHMPALKLAFTFDPDLVFFLTDAEDGLSAKDMAAVRSLNRHARIHCLEFGLGGDLQPNSFLKIMARQNGGSHRYFDVTQFDKMIRPKKDAAQ